MIDALDHCSASMTVESNVPVRAAVYVADQNPHRDRSLGITTMTEALMDQLALRRDVEMTQVVSRSSFHVRNAAIETHRLPFATDRFAGRILADAVHPLLSRLDVDLWYYPKGYAPRMSSASVPCVGTMHDTIIQHYADHYPETRSKLAFRYWLRALSRSLSTFDRVLTVSKSAADQLRSFCDRHKIQTPAIEVTYEGSTWEHYRSLRFEKQDRVIHLASTAIHKRTNELIRHWCQLRSRREALPELVLVGSIDDEARVLIDGNPGIRKMPRLTQEQLRDLVGSCRALLLPSEIEGFGLPAIEAYYVGTPACYVGDTSVDEILNMDREVVLPGRFELGDLGSFESALEQAISLSDSEIRHVSNALFDRFATAKIAERVMHAFRRSIV